MPEPRPAGLVGKRFLVTDDGGGIAEQLAARIESYGAQVRILPFTGDLPPPVELQSADGLVHLWGLHGEHRASDVARFYDLLRQTLLHKTASLVVAAGLGGHYGHFRGDSAPPHHYRRGAGLAGLLKSVAKEWPEIHARCVDLDQRDTPAELARYLELEILARDNQLEVAYRNGRRFCMEIQPAALTPNDRQGDLQLDEDSVVLLTGGARGITAAVAHAFASRYRCRLELAGRTCLDSVADTSEYAEAHDVKALRQRVLAEESGKTPAEVEKLCAHILAVREIRQTLNAIRRAGGQANYTQLDVRDSHSFGEFIAGLYRRHGRIDGVIHGAGIVEDKLVRHKDVESFKRVFDTKATSAMTLCEGLRDDVKFVVFFSSVASAFGNRGQADYAAANDVLDKLAYSLQGRTQGRVVSINWGPWAGAGMVSPELEREYARRGIGLIPMTDGVEALLQELRYGERQDVQVVMMGSTLESMGFGQQLQAGA
jgi:NAD(P)-dependent dehydrogenase (short-subunit alcohol dehydrogenase family)